MESSYSKVSRKQRPSGGGGFLWAIVGLFMGLMLGALLVFILGIAGALNFLSPEATPVVLTQVVKIFDIATSEGEQIAQVVTATEAPTNTPSLPTATPSASPTPTASPTPDLPTITPSPSPDFSISGEVLDVVNIRYGPGADYPRVGIAQANERFQITGYHTQFDWLQIRYDNSPTGFAWIARSLLSNIQGDVNTLPAISMTVFNFPTLTPTPSVVQSSSALTGDVIQISPQFAALGERLSSIMLEKGFEPNTQYFGSLFLLDLQTGEAITIGGDIAYRGTSVNKISILAALYGALDGVPNQTQAVDIANTMICSENGATNRLLAIVGGGDEWRGAELVTTLFRTIGLENSYLLAPYTVDPSRPPVPAAPIPVPDTNADQVTAHPEPYNQITVEEQGWLLESIYQCAYENNGALLSEFPEGSFEPRECRQMLHVMSNNNVDALLRAGVPANVRVAHKHGWVNDTHMNAGVFFTQGGNYVMVMAFHSSQVDSTGERYLPFQDTFPATLPAFAEVSRTVYNYYNANAPLAEIRDGFIPDAPTCNFAGTPLIGDLMQAVWDN